MKKVFKKSKIFLLLGIILIPIFIFSFIFTTKIKASDLVFLDQDKTINKTYLAVGDVLDIRGNINGDAFLAGSSITFSGNINGDLFVVGNNINLNGKVNGNIFSAGDAVTINSDGIDNLFLAGSLINVNSKINKNSYIAGSSIVINKNSSIGQDLLIRGNVVNIGADVSRDLLVKSKAITLNSNIGRNATLLSDFVYFGQNAKIVNNLEASESIQTSANISSVVNGNISTIKEVKENPADGFISSFKTKVFVKLTLGLFAVLIAGLMLIKSFNKVVLRINKDSEKNLTQNLGKGALTFFSLLGLSLLFAITIIGIKISLIILCVLCVMIFIASVFSSIFVGNIFLSKMMKYKNPSLYLSLTVGSLIFIILTIIPFIGWILSLLILFISIGSLANLRDDIIKFINKKV